MTPHTAGMVGAGRCLASTWLVVIALATLAPLEGTAGSPFLCLTCGGGLLPDSLVNVALFVPLGLGLAMSGGTFVRSLLAVALVTTAIEVAQLSIVAGRDASLRDLLANVAGGALGFRMGVTLLTRRSPRADMRTIAGGVMASFVASQVFTAWALQPVVPEPPWSVRVSPHPDDRAIFFGRTIALTLASEPVLPADGPAPRSALDDGDVLSASFVPDRETHGLAAVMRLEGADGSEVAVLAQAGRDVLMRTERRGTALGFHPPIALARGFDGPPGRDTVLVEGWREGPVLHLRSRADPSGVVLEPSASWLWSLLIPAPPRRYLGRARAGAVGWLLVVYFMLGLTVSRWGNRAEALAGAAWTAALMGVGLWLVPLAGDLPVHLAELVPAAGGVSLGAMGRRQLIRASRSDAELPPDRTLHR